MKIDNGDLEKIFLIIKKDKSKGLEKLYNNYSKMIYSIAFMVTKNNENSEDIKQIVFTKIYELDNSKLPTSNYASWLYTLTKNETLNFIKKNKNEVKLENIFEISDENSEINDTIDRLEFNRLINRLNESEKEIVSLKILSNFSFEEIAKMLNKPVGTIKWKYYKSVNFLKTILGNLAMFIVTFAIGIKTILSDKQNNITEEYIEQDSEVQENLIISDENSFQDETMDSAFEDTQSKNIEQDIYSKNNISEDIETDTNTIQETNTVQENTTISNNNVSQYLGYGFIGISIIFLIVIIYFLIKYQLKRPGKLSK